MASYRDRAEGHRVLRRSMLSLEQMLEGKTSLKTQKLTHRNIICKSARSIRNNHFIKLSELAVLLLSV